MLLVLKVCSSNAVIAIEGSTTTLTCPLQSTSFIWIKHTTPSVSILQQGAKYGGVNTRHLAIYNVDPDDGGFYTCRTTDVPPYQKTMNVVFRANGNWGSWGDWAECTKTCVGGTKTRNRYCDNPTSANDGSPCQGSDSETVPCPTAITCTVYGNWSTWGGWSQCTKTCVGGTRTRHRTCDNPVNGSYPCLGLNNETVSCSTTIQCPVHGNWGTWQEWNSCSATCGSGSRSRRLECNNTEPAFGGSDCQGNDTEIESCSIKLCPEIPRVKTATYEKTVDDNSSAAIGIGSTAVVVGLLIVSIYIM